MYDKASKQEKKRKGIRRRKERKFRIHPLRYATLISKTPSKTPARVRSISIYLSAACLLKSMRTMQHSISNLPGAIFVTKFTYTCAQLFCCAMSSFLLLIQFYLLKSGAGLLIDHCPVHGETPPPLTTLCLTSFSFVISLSFVAAFAAPSVNPFLIASTLSTITASIP